MASRLLSLLPLLALALAARPGEALVLPFPGLPPGPLEVASDLPLLLAPQASDGGVVLVAVEVPHRLPPGGYRVCLRQGNAPPVCQEVEVEALPRLEARVPGEVLGSLLRFPLRNGGNVPLRVFLAPEEGSEVGFPPTALSLAPGEEREAALPLFGFGLLRLGFLWEGRKEVRLVRVRPEGGKPPPYALLGRAEGGFGGGAPWGRFSLEGSLSREARAGFLLERGPSGPFSLRLALGTGPFSLRLAPVPSPSLALGYREGPWEGVAEYPLALEGRYSGEVLYALRLSPEALSGGYADGTWVLSFALPFARPEGLALKVERYGAPYLYARWEGGLYLGFAQGPLQGEAGQGPQGPSGFLEYRGREAPLAFGLRAGYRGTPFLDLHAGYGGPPDFSLRLGLPGPAWGVGLGHREGPWTFRLDLSGAGATGFLEWREGPWALRLEGRYGPPLALALSGSYAFSLPVPEEATLALGGYEEVPLEGRVEVLGKPVEGARVEGGLAPVRADGEGRFRLYVPRGGARLRALPPEGLLALPVEVFWKPGEPPPVLALRPASALRLECRGGGRGAYLVGEVAAFVDCGGEAILPPGPYRLVPEGGGLRAEEREVALKPLERAEVLLAFAPPPTEALEEARPLRVEWPLEVAPGEVARVRVRLEGASPGEVSLSLPVLKAGREGDDLVLLFQVPWEAEGTLPLEVRRGEKREGRLVPVSPKPLLALRLNPARARVGEEVEVRVEALFPAEGAVLRVGDLELPLAREGEGPPWVFAGRLTLRETLYRQATPLGRFLALPVEVEAWQGGRKARALGRLLLLP